ncbi:MAG: dihydrolipoyl dehydrogenase family protein, partial [Elusimicrobiota bacterium]
MSDYDVFVIGTGTAGSTAASICKNAGLHVGIADRRPFGGTCAQRGCDPKKLLVGAAEIVDKSRKMKGKGIFSDATIDWQDLIRYKNTLIDGVPKAKQKSFDKASIDSFKGECSFVGKNKIEIEGERVVSADKIVIATGAEPLMLNVPGWDTLTTSDKFLRLQNLPDKIIFVGGGYISFEFAHLAARSGADTVILNDTERPLAKFENFLVDKLVKASRYSGVDVKLNEQVTVIEKKGDRFMVETKGGSKYEAGLAVHGAGRIPAVNRLKLDRAGIDADKKGIIINDRLQSVSNPDVYVAGDANGRGIPLTPVAAMEGSIVGHN